MTKSQPVASRPATSADFADPILRDAPFGVFQNVNDVSALIPTARLLSFEADTKDRPQIVFAQQDQADGKLRVILSGEFSVRHTILDESHQICIDRPGTILGDVELLAAGVDAKEFGRGRTGGNFSTVVCTEPGRVLEFDPSPLRENAAFVFNIGRQVAWKLLRRNADSDVRFLKENKRLVLHLQTLVKRENMLVSNSYRNRYNQPNEREWELALAIRKVDAARALTLKPATVGSIARKLETISDGGFAWEGKRIELSAAFVAQLKANPKQFWRRGGSV